MAYVRNESASFFPSAAHQMAAVRRSSRLRKQEPDIKETAYKCHFCLKEDDACRVGTIQLPCCKHFVHLECQKQWEAVLEGERKTCAMCRQPMQIILPAPAERGLTNGQVVTRLRELLNSDRLRQELQQVSTMSIEDFLHFSDMFDALLTQWFMVRNDRMAADFFD